MMMYDRVVFVAKVVVTILVLILVAVGIWGAIAYFMGIREDNSPFRLLAACVVGIVVVVQMWTAKKEEKEEDETEE